VVNCERCHFYEINQFWLITQPHDAANREPSCDLPSACLPFTRGLHGQDSLDRMRAILTGAGIALLAIAIVGIWLIALPWTTKYRRSSRWFRDVAIAGGFAALLSSSGHALLLFHAHALSRVRFVELQTLVQVVSGMWMGLLFSLLFSAEFWEPRPPSHWRTRLLKGREI
jgi:hypothetical protein